MCPHRVVGSWGKVIKNKKDATKPPVDMTFESNVERIIWQQKKMGQTVYDWKLTGKKQFPLLYDIGFRLAVAAIQSADVERCYKAHKVNYTVARNRIHNKTVHQLLYTYINLRLLKKCSKGMEDFLTGAISGCNDEGEGGDTVTSTLEEAPMGELEAMVVDVDDFDQEITSPMEQVN